MDLNVLDGFQSFAVILIEAQTVPHLDSGNLFKLAPKTL